MLRPARVIVAIAHRLFFMTFVSAVLTAAVVVSIVISATPSSAVHSRRRSFGSNLAGTLLLEIATAIEAFNTIRYAARLGCMAMLGAPLTEERVARALVTLEQMLIVMPALASLVVALPGALALSLVSHARTSAPGRGIPLMGAVRPVPSVVVSDFAAVATKTTSFVLAIAGSVTHAARVVSTTTRGTTVTRRGIIGSIRRIICGITVNCSCRKLVYDASNFPN